jgi:hypothetical protein
VHLGVLGEAVLDLGPDGVEGPQSGCGDLEDLVAGLGKG